MTDLTEQVNKWKLDFPSYAKDNQWIINKKAELVPLILNRMQIKIWKVILYHLQNGIPIRLLVIKDRQLGCTTEFAAIFYWISTLFANKNCLIVSHDIESASGIFNKIKLFFKKSKDELRPLRKISNRRELYFANPDESGPIGLESRVTIDTADTENLGVSYTIQFVLLSEMAVWEAMGLDVKKRLVALHQAIPELPGTAIIIETTPRGEGYVSEMWNNDDNGYLKIFISSCASDEYRVEVPKDQYFELTNYEEHKYGNEEEEYFYYEKELKFWYGEDLDFNTATGKEWLHHEVICRLAWRRITIDRKCEGDKLVFDREYPITIDKAFASSGSSLFNINRLNELKAELRSNPPKVSKYRYTSVQDDFYNDLGGSLRVFREYDPKFKYVIGCDVGQGGIGGDDSALSCRRVPGLAQMCTFSEVVKPLEFAKIINRLGRIYGKAFVGVEVNEKGGFACQDYLDKLFHYPNMFSRNVMIEPFRHTDKEVRYGWNTNAKTTKPVMISDYDELLVTGELEILDEEIIEIAKKYKLKIVKLKAATAETTTLMGASIGKDDLLIADMIAVQLARFIHIAPTVIPARKKWTAAWWMSLLDKENFDVIGSVPRGPDRQDYSNYGISEN